MTRFIPEEVALAHDPIDELASYVQELVFDEPDLMRTINLMIFKRMGLHPNTMLGGDESDRREFILKWVNEHLGEAARLEDLIGQQMPDYIIEDDPRYEIYWALLDQIWNQVHGQIIARSRHVWGHRAQAVRGESNEAFSGEGGVV